MISEADKFWNEIAPIYRRSERLKPLTAAEADAAYDTTKAIPMSAEEIQYIVDRVTGNDTSRWVTDSIDWTPDEETSQVSEDMYAIHRDEGEPEPETDSKEKELRDRMLNDEPTNQQDGVDGGTTPPEKSSDNS